MERPNTSRPLDRKDAKVMSIEDAELIGDTEYDEDGNIIAQTKQKQNESLNVGAVSARQRRGAPISDALHNLSEQISRKKTIVAEKIEQQEKQRIQ